jgi:Protein of unknown function (DUF3500)
MTESGPIPAEMRAAAAGLLAGLDEQQRALACVPFADTAARHRISYLPGPRPRPGVCLADLDRRGCKAAYRLLATALSPSAYAQAAVIMALEEILDRREGWHRGRHSGDFWIVIFGDPAFDEHWAWRWEGHHLSVSLTIHGEKIFATPLFLGSHPAAISVAGRPVIRPFGMEEDLARALMDAMGPGARGLAVIASSPPSDIRSSMTLHIPGQIVPLGVSRAQLNPVSTALLEQLTAVYLGRLLDAIASAEAVALRDSELHFAWEGPVQEGLGHYYRIQGDGLLIEYNNTSHDANHVHTVLRHLEHDFGRGWSDIPLGGRTPPCE